MDGCGVDGCGVAVAAGRTVAAGGFSAGATLAGALDTDALAEVNALGDATAGAAGARSVVANSSPARMTAISATIAAMTKRNARSKADARAPTAVRGRATRSVGSRAVVSPSAAPAKRYRRRIARGALSRAYATRDAVRRRCVAPSGES